MTKVFIIHGTGGNPEGNWFPWLKKELELRGCSVVVPRFPTPKGQSLQAWRAVFETHIHELDGETIVIGHSLGPAFLLDVLERTPRPIKTAFFVAGFIGLLDNPDFDGLNRTFAVRTFDWERILANSGKFVVINSRDDPYVPLAKGKELAKHLKTPLLVLEDAGHINKDSGYTRFDLLLELMKKEL